ncbi:unnamed protein product [Lymnaea stagnalis]|uniref:G-protein coupled receptors family 1 profile domain-containing protein n=1 Tax=Lymnaea stagnalis TaxID=6523 RepID=A0AAV2HK72_LYMST
MEDRLPTVSSRSSLSEELGFSKRQAECVVRKYYIGFSVIMFIVSAAVVVICVSTATKAISKSHVFKTKCPPHTFPCVSDGACINLTSFCDKTKDCSDGSDERVNCDINLVGSYNEMFKKKVDNHHDKTNSSEDVTHCELKNYPPECTCQERTQLCCRFQDLTSFSLRDVSNITMLDLVGNHISDLSMLPFHLLPNLLKLNLMGNGITRLKKGDLDLAHSLKELYLFDNKITTIEEGVFEHAGNLEVLKMWNNSINNLQPRAFAGLRKLRQLDLFVNSITELPKGIFEGMKHLTMLNLSKNKIRSLGDGVFSDLTRLMTINLDHNLISYIDKNAFKGIFNIQTIDLRVNKLPLVENETFYHLNRLSYIYFDKFYLCLNASQATTCLPLGDGISSKDNLLESIILRISVWVVALFSCGGNLLVLFGRFFMREDNRIHSFFIKNLSLADLLMGMYLLIIAVHDVKYRGQYILHDEKWRNSWECDVSGMLSTLSTEMSVLTLSVITLDRYISIMYPLSFRKRGLKLAYGVMAFTWLVCVVLAALPIMGIDYFGPSFYRDNAVCIPLHLHDPRAKGWEYSSFLFLGINFCSFGFIAYAYVAMFYSIHMSALPLRTTRESKERCLVKRFFFIVITDFVCWIPIIIIKIIALGGLNISDELYAWVIVFVLPVNSALNPMLYTLTTKLFKKKLFSKFTSVVFRPTQLTEKDSLQSRSSFKNSGPPLTRHMQYCEMGLLKRYYPSSSVRRAGKPYVVNGRSNGHHPFEDEEFVSPVELSNGNSSDQRYTCDTLIP